LTILAASTVALAFASPAFAQDAAAAGAATAAAPAGFRVEALLGYDRSGLEGSHSNGVLYGVGAGFDFAVSDSVSLGVDAEASDSTAKKYGVKAGRDLYAGARVSFAVSPKANLYVKGGYTNARVSEGACCSINSTGANLDGFRVGAGAQLLVSGKAYVGAEGRYSNYEGGWDRYQAVLTLGTRF
jgi:outer membrane immunogenic protein